MTAELRKLAFRAILVLAPLHVVLNRAVPAWLMTSGRSMWIPDWVRLTVANLLVIVLALVLTDLGTMLWSRFRLSSLCLICCGLGIPVYSMIVKITEPRYTCALFVLAILSLFGVACKRQLPFRAYHAFVWLFGTVLLVVASLLVTSRLSWPYSGWITAAIEISAVCAALAIFASWGTPLRIVSVKIGIVSVLAALDFALLIGSGGHATNKALQEVSGLTLTLPLPVYTIAVFLLAWTSLSLLSQPEKEVRGLSLTLLILGGLSFSGSETLMLALVSVTILLLSYPARENSLWHDWRAYMSDERPTQGAIIGEVTG